MRVEAVFPEVAPGIRLVCFAAAERLALRFQNEIRTHPQCEDRAPMPESAGVASVTGAQTLLRALDILDAFAEEGASLTLADLEPPRRPDRADDAPAREGARLARLRRHRREPPLQPRPGGDAAGRRS